MKGIIIAIILSVGIIGATVVLSGGKTSGGNAQALAQDPVNNVTIEDGKQIISIDAKGGYQPRKSIAKAGIPSVIRFNTSATFDCSSSVRIPSLDISQILPQTGSTDIAVGTPKIGPLEGTCGMGMYPFEVTFE